MNTIQLSLEYRALGKDFGNLQPQPCLGASVMCVITAPFSLLALFLDSVCLTVLPSCTEKKAESLDHRTILLIEMNKKKTLKEA